MPNTGRSRQPVRLVAEASGPDEDEMMALTAREQQQLAEIEHRLSGEEPHLHRAFHRHTMRPLRARARAIARPQRRPRAGIAVVVSVLLAGVAMLVAGEVLGLFALVIPGAIVMAVGPHVACEVMVRRARNKLAAVVGSLPTSRSPDRRRAAAPSTGVSRTAADRRRRSGNPIKGDRGDG